MSQPSLSADTQGPERPAAAKRAAVRLAVLLLLTASVFLLLASCSPSTGDELHEAASTPQGDSVLLRLDFEDTLVGRDGEEPLHQVGTLFGPGQGGEALLVGQRDQLAYVAENNIQLAQGSLEFWVQPSRSWFITDFYRFSLFHLDGGLPISMTVDSSIDSLVLQMGSGVDSVRIARRINGWHENVATPAFHQVVATWDLGAGQVSLFVDGELVESVAASLDVSGALPSQIWIGSAAEYGDGEWAADASLDSLEITSYAKGADVIKEAFLDTSPIAKYISACTIDPQVATASLRGTWTVAITAGPEGIPSGSAIVISLRKGNRMVQPQTDAPDKWGYIAAYQGPEGVGLPVEVRHPSLTSQVELVVRLDEALPPGEQVQVVLGANRRGTTLGRYVTDEPIAISLEMGENALFYHDFPVVNIGPGAFMRLVINAPSTVQAGEVFTATLEAEDRYGNVVTGYRNSLNLSSDGEGQFPAQVTFQPEDKGVVHISASFQAEGPHTLVASAEDGQASAQSNPIVVSATVQEYQLYWGDIHGHSVISEDGVVKSSRVYDYARDVTQLDFAALTEHDANIANNEWPYLEDLAQRYSEDGKFIALLGWERSRPPHKNVYFSTTEATFFRGYTNAPDSPFWSLLPPGEALVISHFTGGKAPEGGFWERWNPTFERLFEIYSSWGNEEYEGAPGWEGSQITAQPGWAAGARVGVIGSGDYHMGHPGGRGSYFTGEAGLVAVWAEDLTRASIFDALYERRCYATSNQRIYVDFAVNGHIMGQEIEASAAPTVTAQVVGTGPLAVEIVKNNEAIYQQRAEDGHAIVSYTDQTYDADSYYYVRVMQDDGEMAWSSPVWVDWASGEEPLVSHVWAPTLLVGQR